MNELVFIKIPEKLAGEINGFNIDPQIPLPVEKDQSIENGSLADLSWEKIIVAMLKILAFHRDYQFIDYYRKFIFAVKPELKEQLIDAGVEKARNNDFTTAEEIFLAVEGLEPENIINIINMALLYEHKASLLTDTNSAESNKYLDKAFDLYKKALSIDSSEDIHFHAGKFFFNRQNFEKAKEHFSFFLELGDPDEDIERRKTVSKILLEIESSNLLDSKFKQAYDMIRLCQEEEGIEIISEFIEKSPDVWNAWFLLGWGYRRTGKYKEAYNAFSKVIELGEKSVDVLNEIAICSIETGKRSEAEKYLLQALKMEPDNVKIISNLGILHYKAGDIEKAKSFFLTSLEFDENDEIAKKYLEIIDINPADSK
ncbi:MAG: tetratricopeptide repeat protein [Spirochaetes bacterium]|nr:tetratricopeptide repeat protein [Spirochaetota bacterium]